MRLWQTNPLQEITLAQTATLRLFPPCVISTQEIDCFLEAFDRAL